MQKFKRRKRDGGFDTERLTYKKKDHRKNDVNFQWLLKSSSSSSPKVTENVGGRKLIDNLIRRNKQNR
jgi:hypothetical protein